MKPEQDLRGVRPSARAVEGVCFYGPRLDRGGNRPQPREEILVVVKFFSEEMTLII